MGTKKTGIGGGLEAALAVTLLFLPSLDQLHFCLIYIKISDFLSAEFHWKKWPSSKSLQTVSAGEGVEKKEPSYTVGGL